MVLTAGVLSHQLLQTTMLLQRDETRTKKNSFRRGYKQWEWEWGDMGRGQSPQYYRTANRLSTSIRTNSPWHLDLHLLLQTAEPDWTQLGWHSPPSLSHYRWTNGSRKRTKNDTASLEKGNSNTPPLLYQVKIEVRTPLPVSEKDLELAILLLP